MSKHKSSSTMHQSGGGSKHGNKNQQQQTAQQHQQQQQRQQVLEPEITKLDYAIANHLRNNLPNKEAMFVGIKRVNYFIGSKAVDLIMNSKWASNPSSNGQTSSESKGSATNTNNTEASTFKTRDDVVIFLNDLLIKKFYHRARKIVKMEGTKRKFKLDMHDVQMFEDSNQPYVWLYEPTSLKAWLYCIGVIVGVILICLFPLWPSTFRTGVYYICIAGLIFLSSILTLAVLRHVVFFALWTVTFGKLHFWILPNLTEDVGVFESFWPLYKIGACEMGEEGGVGEGGGDGEGEGGGTGGGETVNASHSHQD